MDEPAAVIHAPGGGEMVDSPVGGMLWFKTTGTDSAGHLMALENEIPPGEGPPLHVHTREDEVLYVLDGDFRFRLGDEVHDAPTGTFVYIPRGLRHTWQNAGETPGRLLVLFTPAGMEQFFRLADGDRAAFESVSAEVGMEVVGPPLRD
jgi:quercetin dioxygenase-like cupin family protein